MKSLTSLLRVPVLIALGTLAAAPLAARSPGDAPAPTEQPREIVFFDATVPGRAELLAGLKPGVEAGVLGPDRDGFEQIAEALGGRGPFEAIHIVSHASPGNVHLGATVLNEQNLAEHLPQLRAIGRSLAPDGALLLYGCRLGADAVGRAFVEHLSHAVGAPVRASAKLTGSYAHGGSWELDVGSGRARALAFTEATLSRYGYLLTTPSSQNFQGFSSPAFEASPVTLGSFTFTGFIGGSPAGANNDEIDNDDPTFGIIAGTSESLSADTGFVFNFGVELQGAADFRIAAGTGNNFSLTSIQADVGDPTIPESTINTITVTGYVAGVAVSGATATLNLNSTSASNNGVTYAKFVAGATDGGTITFTGNNSFKNIDEIRITGGGSSDFVTLCVDDITVAGPAPAITSGTTASGTYGSAFSYSITASNGPITSYSETGTLPTGVTLNTGSGVISGTPTTNGSFPITVQATNANGTGIGQTVTITIAKAALTVTGVTANDKAYDSTTTATLNTGSAAFVGVVNSDVLTVGTGSASGSFATKTVANGKTVTVTGLTVNGANSSNYTLTQPTTTANITTATLTVTGITASNKPYDGTTSATLNTGSAALVGKFAGDSVTLGVGSASGTFATKTVANGKTVTVTGLTIGNTDAGNYTLTQPTTTANITALGITITGVTASNKPYDGATSATINTGSATLVGVIGGDAVSFSGGSGTFATKTVANGKTVTVSGIVLGNTDAGNYTLTQPTTTANITALGITITGVTASNKPYDGATSATINTGSATLVGVIGGDAVSFSGGSGTFATKTVANGKTVTVSGIVLGNTDAGNYTLTQPTTTANITALGITITGVTASNKPYDGTTSATIDTSSATLVGVVGGDAVSFSGGSGTFATKTVANGKTVTVSGIVLGNTDAGNYTLTQPTTTANITALGITITGVTASNRPYDGTTSATINTGSATLVGVIGGDAVSFSGGSGTFATKTVANGKTVTVSGIILGNTDAGNYALTQPTAIANITSVTLTVSGITASNRPYDGTTSATLNVGGAALVGIISPDVVNLTGTASGTFATKTVANGKTVTISGLTIGGADAGNYTLTQPTATANITSVALTVSGVTANSRAYTATTAATLNVGGAALVGIISPDVVNLTGTATGTFATKTVANGKTVTISGLTIGGADAGNYTLTQPTATANITAAGLTVTGVTANNKAYDGATSATLSTGGAALSGVLLSDVVTLNTVSATGVFATKTVANAKTVTVSGITIGGADAGNYALTQPSPTANITAAGLTVSGVTASNKPYDRTTTATIDVSGAALVGIIAPDVVTIDTTSASGVFATKAAANGKTVTVSGITIGGADAGNYTLTQPSPTANITAIGLTVSGVTAANKAYDTTTTATLNTGGAALAGVIAGDVVTLNVGSAAGAFSNKAVATGKTVTVSGLTLGGADAGNYALTQPTAAANITAAGLTVTGITAANKAYDATTTAVLNTAGAVLSGVFGGDSVTLSTAGAAGAFSTKTVGVGKSVTITGLSLGGTDAGNYVLASPVATATITSSGLTVTGITAVNKPYDGTTAATLTTVGAALVGVIPGDTVTLGTASAIGTFGAKTVGTGKTVTVSGLTISGPDAGNYTLTQPTTTANITSSALTLSGVTASNKVYDTTTGATINSGTATLVGVASGDTVTFTAGTGAFASKTVGVGKAVTMTGFTLGGADGANYTLTQPTATASITAAGLTVTGITASGKVYDTTTAAVIDTSAAVLNGVLGGDGVSLNTATAAGIFSSKDVGPGKTVTVAGLATGGADAGNYLLTAPTTTAAISAAGLTVTGITASDKVFDGTAAATLDTTGAALVGVFAGDTVNLDASAATGAFPSSAIGSGLTVTVSGLALTGADSADYALTQPTATASITAPALGGGGGGGGGGGTGGGTLTSQVITFAPIPGHLPTDAPFTVSATSSSGLALTYAVASGPASVSGSTVTLNGTAGSVTIVATQAGNGTYAAASASQTFIVGSNLGRLINLSARAFVGTGDDVLIAGFVFQGGSPKQFLVRAAGPALAAFGVPGPLALPTLQIFNGSVQISGVQSWSASANAAAIAATAAALGAFPFPVGSADAAVLAPFNPGAYTGIVSGTGGTSGNALLELYDTAGGSGGQNLMNLSARGFVGQGSQVLIAGVVIAGNGPAKILIRAVGPGLAPFGVHGVLADPQVQVFQGSTLVAQNSGWSNDPAVTAADQQLGAFPLTAGGRDSALVVTLAPGSYTAVVSGASGDTGIALVEIYLLSN